MSTSGAVRLALLLLALALAGCESESLAGPPAEWRSLVVTVGNASPWPATLMVGETGETAPITGQPVGIAVPGVVAPGVTTDVTFGVPPGRDWAIFVNPGPGQEPLVTATDVPADAVGEMPFSLDIAEDGGLGVLRQLHVPGWFGNH